MQKARRHPLRGSDRLRAHGFRLSFTPLPGVLFTFPSRYSSTIGLPVVLSLGGWCRQIRTGLLRPRPTQGPGRVRERSAYGAVTRSGPPSQARSATLASSLAPALQPRARLDAPGLGWPPFARRYSGGHCCFPFLRLLGCFGSPGWPPPYGGCRASRAAGFPIRAPADPWLLAPPRGLSRPAAPFVAPGSQGIPRAPSLARSPPGGTRPPAALRALCVLCLVSMCLPLSHPVNEPSRADTRPASWRMWGSNPRPPACKAGALAS